MRRTRSAPTTRSAPSRSVGEMRMEQAEYARDAKREGAKCAHGCCTTSHGLKQGPKGYTGQYGGSKLCEEHYRKVVDHIAKHGCLPSEKDTSDAGSGSQPDSSTDDGLGVLFE